MRGRTITLAILAAALIGLTAGSLATAAAGWKVFAAGTDSSKYGAYVSASADVRKPKMLAIRASKAGTVSWFASCQGEQKVKANQLVRLTVARALKCSVSGSANTDESGVLRVQLLRR